MVYWQASVEVRRESGAQLYLRESVYSLVRI